MSGPCDSSLGVHVYVAGPISRGNTLGNCRAGILACSRLLKAGLVPYNPFLTALWELIDPQEYETWMTLDFAWIARCDCLLRLPGDSPGADREVAEARRLGIPVFYDVEQLILWAKLRAMVRGRRKLDVFA